MAATMKDISKRTGLGLATISKYINGGTVREKNRILIEEAISQLNYTVNDFARGLKSNRSRTVGVVIPELENVFIASIITAMEEQLRARGYSVLVCDCHNDESRQQEAVDFLLSKKAEAIINMPCSPDVAHLRTAQERGVCTLLIDRLPVDRANCCDCVIIDNRAAGRMATDLLLKNGHRDIGIVLGDPTSFTAAGRLDGYKKALQSAGIAENAAYIQHGDYTVESGYVQMQRLLRECPTLTAVFLTSYELTLGAIIAINECGVSIPQRLSVIGFDNLQLAKVVHPKLTIITQPTQQMGHAAASLLLKRLSGKEPLEQPGQTCILQPSLEPGHSVIKL